jgi:Zinc finger, C2H2 type/C2H2-type zinc finger
MSETCTICGAPFASPSELVIHRRAEHRYAAASADTEMNPEAHTAGLRCALCGRRFASAPALAEHNLRPHAQFGQLRRPLPAPTDMALG